MPIHRRHFLKAAAAFTGSTFLSPVLHPLNARHVQADLADVHHTDPLEGAMDEEFWARVRLAYTSSANMINLNSGGVSPSTREVQRKVDLYNQFANEAPGYYMWRVMGKMRSSVRRKLSALAGISPEETALVRSATEALDTAILGIDLKKGDEILTTNQDYPSMINTLHLRQNREGIRIRKLSLPVPSENPQEIVSLFENAITSRTKVILVCHMINLTGQILPVKEICKMAHEHDIQVIIDGAHTFCHIDHKIPDLGGDYYGTSLHKWLCAPFGTGMLYVKKEHIPNLWPMYGYPEGDQEQITKFEHLGTRSFPLELAVSDAIDFHTLIGTPRKEARLRYLKDRWTNQVLDVPGLILNTSLKPEFSCGIANFMLEGWEPEELGIALLRDYNIYTTTTTHEDVTGIRISPNVFTSLEEMDFLAETIRKLAKK